MNKEERLREYINKDYSYINYKIGVEEGTDFDKFCIQHCKDIEELLKENMHLKEHIEKYEHYCKTTGIEELMQENQKYKEVINKLQEWIYIVQQDKDNKHLEPIINTDELDELLDILKEVK